MSERPSPPNAPSDRRLSVGDGVAIVALLAFAAGWIGFWTIDLDDTNEEDWNAFAAVLWLVIVSTPALWAGRLVTHIVKGESSE